MPIPDPGSHSFDVTILKNKSGSDTAQIPASASIKVLEPGATVSVGITVPDTSNDPDPQPTTVEVYDSTTLNPLDFLAVNSAASNQLRVASAPTISTQVKLMNLLPAPITLNQGDRLVRLAAPVAVFKDRTLTTPDTNPLNTEAATGRARAYITAEKFDYVATGSGFAPRVFADVRGRHSPHWVNARAFASIQAAIDYAESHQLDTVYIPAGVYNLTSRPAFVPPLLLPQHRHFRLVGDGPRATTLHNSYDAPFPYPPDVDLIRVRAPYQTIEGLTLMGYAFAPGTGVGIRVARGVTISPIAYRVHVRDVEIRTVPGWGIMIDDTPYAGVSQIAVWGIYENIEIDQEGQGGGGISIGSGGTTTQVFHSCNIKNCSTHAVHVKQDASGAAFVNCIFEASFATSEFVKLDGAINTSLSHCWFEGRQVVSGLNYKPYLRIGSTCRNVSVAHCLFSQKSGSGSDEKNMKAIHVESGARNICITDPFIFMPQNSDPPGGEGKHIIFEPPPSGLTWDDVRIVGGMMSDGNPTPRGLRVFDGSVDVALGPSSRFRMPRLTGAEITTLASPTVGDLVFNVTIGKAQVWDGTVWQPLW